MMRVQRFVTINLIAIGTVACGSFAYHVMQSVQATAAQRIEDNRLCNAQTELRRLAIEYPPVGNLWILGRGDANPCLSRGKAA